MRLPDSVPASKECKLCGGHSGFAYSVDNTCGEPAVLDVFLCRDCGLLFVGTPITSDQLAKVYGTFDWDAYYRDIDPASEHKAVRAVDDLAPLIGDGRMDASVLDVGCGNGHFLDSLRRAHPSISAAGHELPSAAATAAEQKGFTVFVCPLDAVDRRFSVVTLLDVAEHVPRPDLTFAACHGVLREDGYIYIHTPRRCFWDQVALTLVRVPLLEKLSKAWLRSRVSIFHLHLWSDRALRLCLQRAGFQLVYLKSEMELSWPLGNYVNVYLGRRLPFRSLLVKLATGVAAVVFVWLGTLRNKAICLARKVPVDGHLPRLQSPH